MKMLPDSLLIWILKWSKPFWQNSVSFCVELRSLQEKKKILNPLPSPHPSNNTSQTTNQKMPKNNIQGIFSPEEQLSFVIQCNTQYVLSWSKTKIFIKAFGFVITCSIYVITRIYTNYDVSANYTNCINTW